MLTVFFKQKTVAQRCHNLLFVCKFINIIVRLTTAVDYNDDNATDMCSVRAAASWALLVHIISKENKWQIQAWWAVTHEQFSVPHGHKTITQFINKMINVNGGNMKAHRPCRTRSTDIWDLQKQHYFCCRGWRLRVSQMYSFGIIRCRMRWLSCTADCVVLQKPAKTNVHTYIFAISEYWLVMYECHLNVRTI